MQRFFLLGGLLAASASLTTLLPTREVDMTQEELEALTEEIKVEVEELRGLQFLRPVKVEVTDKEGFLAYAKDRIDQVSSMDEIRAQESVAKLLGMFPYEMDMIEETMTVLEEQVGGFYDPSADAFFLMDSFGGDLAKIILAHELTHALDDQHFDIDGTIEKLKGNSDALFAFHAVVEGSGTSVMNRWTIERMAELDKNALADGGGISTDAIAEAPPFLWKPLLGTYLCGAAFLSRTESIMKGQMTAPDPDDFDHAFRKPPRSSEQIFHPEKYWDEVDPPVELVANVDELPEGWELLYEDTLGELNLALATEPVEDRGGLEPMAMLTMSFTDDAAIGWEGDRFVLLGRGKARVLFSQSTWDDADEASEFLEGLEALDDHLRESAAGYAKALGVEGSALHLSQVVVPDLFGNDGRTETVHVGIGAGVDEEELDALLDSVWFEVEEASESRDG